MKVTIWIQGSSKPLEHRPVAEEIDAWAFWIEAIQNGTFVNDFLLLDDDQGTEHYIRVSLIDVIKVENE